MVGDLAGGDAREHVRQGRPHPARTGWPPGWIALVVVSAAGTFDAPVDAPFFVVVVVFVLKFARMYVVIYVRQELRVQLVGVCKDSMNNGGQGTTQQ